MKPPSLEIQSHYVVRFPKVFQQSPAKPVCKLDLAVNSKLNKPLATGLLSSRVVVIRSLKHEFTCSMSVNLQALELSQHLRSWKNIPMMANMARRPLANLSR